MEKQKYAKIITVLLWVLLILSVGVYAWGALAGFEAKGGKMTDVLFYWTYIMIGIALCGVIIVGLYITIRNNPKSLIKLCLVAVAAVVLVAAAYFTASGAPALGFTGAVPPTESELKLTDTVLNLAYILGVGAILSIIVGEIVMSIRGKKA